MIFSAIATQILAKTTDMLSGLQKIEMSKQLYFSTILPIGVFFSASLTFSNYAYIYLSVSFIQMIKVFIYILILGYYSCRCFIDWIFSSGRKFGISYCDQCYNDSSWSDDCLLWGDTVRLYWVCFSDLGSSN